jgi:pilus assembly protein Flp/PilA
MSNENASRQEEPAFSSKRTRRLLCFLKTRDFVEASTPARAGISPKGRNKMRDTLLKLYVKFQGLRNGEEGQDLVEYALLVALIALVCVSGVSNVATAVNGVFSNISSSLA